MQHILLCPNKNKDGGLTITNAVAKHLLALGFSVYISSMYPLDVKVNYYYDELPDVCELLLVIGGDGTVIDTLDLALRLNIPLVGVNLGKVGYLAEVEPCELSLFEQLKNNDFDVEDKLLIEGEILLGGVSIGHTAPTLNDIVVSRKTEDTLASLSVFCNGTKALNYRADGVIVSTPQGSTAYSLSCGGPMLSHELCAIELTPICPHSFLNRSMVFSDETTLEIGNIGEHPLLIVADGRTFGELPAGGICKIFKSQKTLKMISFKKDGHLQSIFRKLRRIENF